MRYKPDWEKAKERYRAWWQGEECARVALQVTAPRAYSGKAPPLAPDDIKLRYTDIDYVMERTLYDFEHTYFAAEAFPCFWPNLGPDFMGACLGAELVYGETTSWAIPCLDSLEGVSLSFDESNPYYVRMAEMSRVIAQNAPGNYIYGVTDLHPSLDTLCALRGAENIMMDLVDVPDVVSRSLADVTKVFDELYTRLYQIGRKFQPEGSTTTLAVFSQGRYFANVCDLIYLISPGMYEQFVRPVIEHELDFFDETIFHVDGVGSLTHLDSILSMPKLKAVQWVYGDGQPGARHWLEVYKKIQDAGKLIYTYGPPSDLEELLKVLDPSKLLYSTRVSTTQEADEYVKWAEKMSHHKKMY